MSTRRTRPVVASRRRFAAARCRSRAGFSVLELMVALTVGGIAISSIYAVGAASTRVFFQQQQVANAQTALRMAMDQVKRDITRAGYLSTPRADLIGQSCGPVAAALHTAVTNPLSAITRFRNDLVPSTSLGNDNVIPGNLGTPATNRNSGFTIDEVVLLGNYETTAEYPGVTLVNNNTISLSDNWHAFRRDFTNWYDPDPALGNDATAINRAFAVGRMIRLRLTNNLYHFATITAAPTGATAAPPNDIQISFQPGVDPACTASVDGAWLAPVSAIRYFVRNATAGSLDVARDANATGRMAQLIREEVQPANKVTALDIGGGQLNSRAIVDYVVGFNLEFTLTAAFPPAAPPEADSYTIDQTTNVQAVLDASPEHIRSVIIDLAVRTPEQDPTFEWTAAGCALQRCYRVFDDRPGAARVRRMRVEVFVPNVANEGY